jgi:competence ComEA-like helix-hairpin-helix protein
MFVISDELYQKMEPHILLPDEIAQNEFSKSKEWKKNTYTKKIRQLPKIDIFTASAEELRKLYGIGPTLSKRIIEQRELLGGFIAKDQLGEIYGLKDSVLIRLDTQLLFTAMPVSKININTISADELKKHPYVGWKIANSIVNYREQHGSYKSLHDLKKSYLINDSLFQKLKPYITL